MTDPRPSQPDPRVRLAVASCALAVALAAPRPASALLVAAAAAFGLARGHRLRARLLLPALLVGLPAAALAAWLGTDAPGELSPGAATGWPAGLARGALLLARVLASSLVLAWLAAGLRLAELTSTLAALRVPAMLLDLVTLADGQRHLLRRSLQTVQAAQALRAGEVGAWSAAHGAGVLVGAVACHAIERSSVTAEAIQLRGGVASHRLQPFRPRLPDLALLLSAAGVLGLATALAWGPAW